MGTTVNKMLNQARSWLGCKESNGTHKKIIDVYNAHKPLARSYKVKYTDNWCATFISACAIKCGATDIIPTECSCGQMIELMKAKGIWIENDDITPKAGDIIMYDWDKKDGWPEHVGIVESVNGNTFTVIEGNKNDAVARRTINVGNASIRGYGRPKYQGESASVPSTGLKYTVGQKVRFSTCYKSSTAPNNEAILASNMAKDNGTITKIASGAKNPYLLDDGLCWVNDGDIREVLSGASSNSSASQNGGSGDDITIDGQWGKATTTKAQKVFGTAVDGIVSNQHDDYKAKNKGLLSSTFEWKANPGKNGSALIKAIQRWCGVSDDGFIGPNTIKAMQRKLGTPADGVVSYHSAMVEAFQRWLNNQ